MLLTTIDPAIKALIDKEKARQQSTLNLIASENYTHPAVLEAQSTELTNKYAEGYPHKRYYGGCEHVDTVETLAITRAQKLFNAEHINVQPHSGSQANMALYAAVLAPGDTILGMNLAAGGHLTHGSHVNFSGSFYSFVHYGVHQQTEMIDYDEVARLAETHRPKLIIAGASAYSRTIDFAEFKKIADSVGAYFAADIAHIAGLVAANVHPSPFPHTDIASATTHKTLRGPRGGLLMSSAELADSIDRAVFPGAQGGPLMHTIAAKAVAFELALQPEFATYQQQTVANARHMAASFAELGYRVVAGGTDTHLFILDLTSHKITGRECELLLNSLDINISRSCIPNDPLKPWVTSGIRIGTPAVTTRGFDTPQCNMLVELIDRAIKNRENHRELDLIKAKVTELAAAFPIYGEYYPAYPKPHYDVSIV